MIQSSHFRQGILCPMHWQPFLTDSGFASTRIFHTDYQSITMKRSCRLMRVYVLRGGNHARVPRRRLLREEVDHQDVATYP